MTTQRRTDQTTQSSPTTRSATPRTTLRVALLCAAGLAVAAGAVTEAVINQPMAPAPGLVEQADLGALLPALSSPRGANRETRQPDAGVGVQDGALPDGASIFDDQLPGVARLDPDLLDALRAAATDAAEAGVDVVVNSGWRSRRYQEELLEEAVAQYGSADEAARWVATPDTSPHVSGDAVDLGPADAAAWLAANGAAYGLCRVYANEPWHFELRALASDDGCPPAYADASADPRMRR